MEAWREAWLVGFAPSIPTEGLVALRDALRGDDPRLIQGETVYPPRYCDNEARLCEGACALGYVGAVMCGGFGTAKVGAVHDWFMRALSGADRRTSATQTAKFLEFFDCTPRAEMRRELLAEVERTLAERNTEGAV